MMTSEKPEVTQLLLAWTNGLVNEACLHLITSKSVQWQNRAQFFGLMAQARRRILVNHAMP